MRNNTMANDKWKMFKNYMHNELGITKEDIEQWTKEAVEEVATSYVEDRLSETTLPNLVKRIISRKWLFSHDILEQEVLNVAGKELAKQLKLELKDEDE